MKKYLSLLSIICATISSYSADYTVSKQDLWPSDKMPGTACSEKEMIKTPQDAHILYVSRPTLELFKTTKSDKPTGLVIVCPGGGYGLLAYTKEGTDIAQWLADEGISAVVLKYRVPQNRDGALMDVQRAIRTARANAKEWNIDPDKIAVLGFSAGANLSARASTLYGQKTYEPIDSVDEQSAKPNFTCLIYPAYCDEPTFQQCWGTKAKKESKDYNTDYAISSELKIDDQTPPAFIIQTQDDKMWVNSSIAYYLALKKAKVPASLHIFDSGGHGYGLRATDKLVGEWKKLCQDWLKKNKFAD